MNNSYVTRTLKRSRVILYKFYNNNSNNNNNNNNNIYKY